MGERCECCDLPEEWCGKAVEDRKRKEAEAERARLLRLPGVVAAQYPSRCQDCQDHYSKGEPIRMGINGWVHAECE